MTAYEYLPETTLLSPQYKRYFKIVLFCGLSLTCGIALFHLSILGESSYPESPLPKINSGDTAHLVNNTFSERFEEITGQGDSPHPSLLLDRAFPLPPKRPNTSQRVLRLHRHRQFYRRHEFWPFGLINPDIQLRVYG